jgi:hypothetical protein
LAEPAEQVVEHAVLEPEGYHMVERLLATRAWYRRLTSRARSR